MDFDPSFRVNISRDDRGGLAEERQERGKMKEIGGEAERWIENAIKERKVN